MEPINRLREMVNGKPVHVIGTIFHIVKNIAKPLFNLSAAILLFYFTFEVLPWIKEKYRLEAIAQQPHPEPDTPQDKFVRIYTPPPPLPQNSEMMSRPDQGLSWSGLFNLRWQELPGTWWDIDGVAFMKKVKFKDDGRLRVLDGEGHAKNMAWFTWKDALVLKDQGRTVNIHVILIGHNGIGAQVIVGNTESKDGPAKVQLVQVTGNLLPALDREYDGP